MSETSITSQLNLTFPESLPINQRRQDIQDAVLNHQVVIIAGETGSGKTTQLPKMLLSLGRGQTQLIGHTQPRRLAARSVAARISAELGVELGGVVGYQVRFTDQQSDQTRLKLMTDGILLAEIQHDRLLKKYDTLIIDEAHERSLNIDFLLGYLKRILPQRPDLKLIVTSATIDVERFSAYFDEAPIIAVEGRTYPVEVHYEDQDQHTFDLTQAVVDRLTLIDMGRYGARGDVLVFLPGEREIRDIAKALKGQESFDVLPLYARLSAAEQNRVFQTTSRRGIRVVLATNVAETSLTVPGIRYVIDPGTARISRYSYRSKLQRLPIEPVSQASANQRKGRCGRVAEGVCIRLYSEDDFLNRPEFTDPEIKRTNLAQVILQMRLLKLGDVQAFPFIEPPDPRLIRDGFTLLNELGAVDPQQALTPLGHQLARLPVDPRLGRMIIAAQKQGALAEILVIVSALAVQDPRERPAEKREQADTLHRRFQHEKSDFLSWIQLWQYLEEQRTELGTNPFRKLCQREFLNYLRIREWRDTHRQLVLACRAYGWAVRDIPLELDYESIHRSLMAGLLSYIATHHEGPEYEGARQQKLRIFPGSVNYKKRPKWIMAAEIVETTQVFARTCAAVEPAWALDINPSLLKRHHYEPSWHLRSGRVLAYERVSLYGLTLSDKQRVNYAPIDPVIARDVFIREALVTGRIKPRPPFLSRNLSLLQELVQLEEKTRRRDLIATEQALAEFYNERLPANVASGAALMKALKRDASLAEQLTFAQTDVLVNTLADGTVAQFPDRWEWRDLSLSLSYHFEPGHVRDGVTLTVPSALLNRLPRYLPQWLVPGLLPEKLIALVKTLPKRLRKQLVPVPDKVHAALATMTPADTPLLMALSEAFKRTAGVVIQPEDFGADALEPYYQMNICIVGDEGDILRQGRDLEALIAATRATNEAAETHSETGSAAIDKALYTDWTFDDLPAQIQFTQAQTKVTSYPALTDRGDAVQVVLYDYPEAAEVAHKQGLLRLALTSERAMVRDLQRHAFRSPAAQKVLLAAGIERSALVGALASLSFAPSLVDESRLVRSRSSFEKCLKQNRRAVLDRALRFESLLLSALQSLGDTRVALGRTPSTPELTASKEDALQHYQRLLHLDEWVNWPVGMMDQLPRFAKALAWRVERLQSQLPKDHKSVATLQPLEQRWIDLVAQRSALAVVCEPLQEYHWMLEEFRVSLFAQQLGTKMPVSVKRLEAAWQSIEQWLIENPL